MRRLSLTTLFLLFSIICFGQISDSTIVILGPLEVKTDPKLSKDILSYTGINKKAIEKMYTDSTLKKLNNKEALLINGLKNYKTNSDIGSVFSFLYSTFLYNKLEGDYYLKLVGQDSDRDINKLRKTAIDNNSRWVINVSNIDFYIDEEELSLAPNGNKGRLKIELFDIKTNKIELTQELQGDTSPIQWFLPCEKGEFKCIVNHLVGNSIQELSEYFLNR